MGLVGAIVGELHVDAEIFPFQQRDYFLERIAIFAGDAHKVALDGSLHLLLAVLDHSSHDLARFIGGDGTCCSVTFLADAGTGGGRDGAERQTFERHRCASPVSLLQDVADGLEFVIVQAGQYEFIVFFVELDVGFGVLQVEALMDFLERLLDGIVYFRQVDLGDEQYVTERSTMIAVLRIARGFRRSVSDAKGSGERTGCCGELSHVPSLSDANSVPRITPITSQASLANWLRTWSRLERHRPLVARLEQRQAQRSALKELSPVAWLALQVGCLRSKPLKALIRKGVIQSLADLDTETGQALLQKETQNLARSAVIASNGAKVTFTGQHIADSINFWAQSAGGTYNQLSKQCN